MKTLTQRPYASYSDRELLDELAVDCRVAFAEIYERYWYRVFGLAYRRLKSRETAEELVQELFVALWQRRTELDIQQLDNYLLTSISRRVISYLRDQRVRTAYADFCRMSAREASDETQQALDAADLSEAYSKALLHLPQQSQKIFRMSRLEHYSVQDIAQRMNLSTKAVEYHLTKSLRIMRLHLRDFIITGVALLFLK